MGRHETNTRRPPSHDRLADGLGWFSLGLGMAQLLAPRALCRVSGLRDEGIPPRLMRARGVTEIAKGLGILARPKPVAWLWGRVAGDVLDLAALARAAASGRHARGRNALAIAAVSGVGAADVAGSVRLTARDAPAEKAVRVHKTITINRTAEDVRAAWESWSDKSVAESADVRYEPAPGGRGTELHIELAYEPPAGMLGATAARLAGKDPATQLSDDLRRFKQLVETGEIVRSDASLAGHALADQLRQRAAQPPTEEEAHERTPGGVS